MVELPQGLPKAVIMSTIISSREQAARLQRGERVTVAGTTLHGDAHTTTGYVVIVCNVVNPPDYARYSDGPLAVTLNAEDAYTGDPGKETTVYIALARPS